MRKTKHSGNPLEPVRLIPESNIENHNPILPHKAVPILPEEHPRYTVRKKRGKPYLAKLAESVG